MRPYALLLAGLALLLGALLLAEPRPLDFRPDYRHTSADPLGGAVLHALLPAWTGTAVETVAQTPYVHLADTALAGTYFFLTDTFDPDPAELERLLAFAARGGTVFVAANVVGDALGDTLSGVRVDGDRRWDRSLTTVPVVRDGGDSLLHLAAPGLARPSGYRFPLDVRDERLDGLDSARTTALGTDVWHDETLVRVPVGRGAFVVSSTPAAFSNAALTGPGDGAAYVAGVLGYLPAGPVLWDARHKPGRQGPASPLRVVLATPPLRWAFTLLLLGAALFAGFRGRRWQRPVPVGAPPPNALVGFVRTVGRLYAQHGDRARLVERRRRYFFDRLRTRLGLADPDLSADTEARVAARSALPPDEVAALFDRFRRFQTGAAPTTPALLDLDRALLRFYDALGR